MSHSEELGVNEISILVGGAFRSSIYKTVFSSISISHEARAFKNQTVPKMQTRYGR